MPAAAAPARPRLLRRPVSDARRQASRRNGAKSCGPRTPAGMAHSSRNARRHGFYAKLHLFTPEETEALREQTRYFIESFRPAGPLALALVRQIALASFQMRRINQIEFDFWTRNPGDFLAFARLRCTLGAIEHRYRLRLFRCLRRLDRLATENEANEPQNLLKQNVEPASAGFYIPHFFASLASVRPASCYAEAGPPRSGVPGTIGCGLIPGRSEEPPTLMSRTRLPRSTAPLSLTGPAGSRYDSAMKLACAAGAGILLAAAIHSAPAPPAGVFSKDNLIAWCIVPFDANNRGPEERAEMLHRLGIRMLAYDWRDKDIPTFDREIDALAKHGIRLQAFWLTSGPNAADDKNVALVLDLLKRRNVKTEIWYMFVPPRSFADLPQERKIEMVAATVRYLAAEAGKIGCEVGLYNHGGWFGEPDNQIAVIERVKLKNVGLVYNFHHGREQMDRFSEMFPKMLPYLLAVNLNGMKKDAPMIIPIGDGDREIEMLKVIRRSNYKGPIGILGHRAEMDVEVSLKQNLEGLRKLLEKMGDRARD